LDALAVSAILARWLITPQLMPGVSQPYDRVECSKN
jgi:hypothetical protein